MRVTTTDQQRQRFARERAAMQDAALDRARAIMQGTLVENRASVALRIAVDAEDIARLSDAQRDAFMRGVGLVMAAAARGGDSNG